MASRISSIYFFLGAVVISCFAAVSLANTFADENPIKLVSDGVRESQSAVFSIMDGLIEDLPFARLISPRIEAIYQFGDSISDTGNLIHTNPLSNYVKPPYGQTYFRHPTGRCSNGLLMVDYFAKYLNLPFLDAYLNKDGNFSHGVNFAVSGAAALDSATLATKFNISADSDFPLSLQLSWFKSHLYSICSNASECKKQLAKAIFIMGEIGGNDFNYAFLQGKSMHDVYRMVPDVVQTIKRSVEEIIDLGAVRIFVPGNFPVGCMTIYLAVYKTNDSKMYDEFKCLKHLNSFAKFYNHQLQRAIQGLQKDHPNVAIMYMDYYAAMKEILQHPTSLGFDKKAMYKTCCGYGDNDYNFDLSNQCGTDKVRVCRNSQERLSWDGIHLTQHAYHVMAKWLMRHILSSISNVP